VTAGEKPRRTKAVPLSLIEGEKSEKHGGMEAWASEGVDAVNSFPVEREQAAVARMQFPCIA
jgi:hypothetical protein